MISTVHGLRLPSFGELMLSLSTYQANSRDPKSSHFYAPALVSPLPQHPQQYMTGPVYSTSISRGSPAGSSTHSTSPRAASPLGHLYHQNPIRMANSPLESATPSSSESSISVAPETPRSPNNSSTFVPKRRHSCKVCNRMFTTLGHLARHNRTHTGERKHLCLFPHCDARFARQDNCMQHYKTHMNGKRRKNRLKKATWRQYSGTTPEETKAV